MAPEAKQKIQSNFNLSFNNSFNTSYSNSTPKNNLNKKALSKVEFQSTLNSEELKHDYKGCITKDNVNLENQLNRADNKIEAIGNTFDEVIKRDKDFGSLLIKIKAAYDSYLRKIVEVVTPISSKESDEETIFKLKQ